VWHSLATEQYQWVRLTSPPPAQTSIVTDGFRSLADGEQVEFYVESGDDGRTKAVQVTGPGGAPPQGESRPHRACVQLTAHLEVSAHWEVGTTL
jgi:hypothetical protein